MYQIFCHKYIFVLNIVEKQQLYLRQFNSSLVDHSQVFHNESETLQWSQSQITHSMIVLFNNWVNDLSLKR